MAALRLAMITRSFWPITGGVERMLAELAGELTARGVKVSVLTTRWQASWPERIDYRGADVLRLPRTSEGYLGTRRMMRNLVRALRQQVGPLDAVYVRGMKHQAYAVMKTVDRRRVAVVLRPESSGRLGDCHWQLDSPGARRVKRLALKADALIGGTEIARRELVAAGYRRDRIHAIFGGVRIPSAVTSAGKTAAREALKSVNTLLHCPPDTPLAVYTGRLDDAKSTAAAIRAWRHVARRRRNARLWLIGRHADQVEINRQIVAARLEGRVVVPGVFTNVSELLTAADAAIVDGDDHDSPAVLLEAMAAGLPVAAVNSAENRCVTDNGQYAQLFTPGDAEGLGQTLVEMLDDTDRAAQLGAAARRHVEQHHNLDDMVDKHMALFEDLVRKKRGLQYGEETDS